MNASGVFFFCVGKIQFIFPQCPINAKNDGIEMLLWRNRHHQQKHWITIMQAFDRIESLEFKLKGERKYFAELGIISWGSGEWASAANEQAAGRAMELATKREYFKYVISMVEHVQRSINCISFFFFKSKMYVNKLIYYVPRNDEQRILVGLFVRSWQTMDRERERSSQREHYVYFEFSCRTHHVRLQ